MTWCDGKFLRGDQSFPEHQLHSRLGATARSFEATRLSLNTTEQRPLSVSTLESLDRRR